MHLCASVRVSVYELTDWLLRNKTHVNVNEMVLKNAYSAVKVDY